MHFSGLAVGGLLLSLSALAAAMPEPHWPKPPKSTLTCPASTPFTTIYVKTLTSTYTTVATNYITQTFPTTATLPRSCPTVYTEVPGTSCSFDINPCTRLACLEIATRTAVCQTNTDPCCTSTKTSTLYQDCPTRCPTGCATSFTTITQCSATATPVPMPTPV